MTFEQEDLFPHGVPIASDGWGNFWVVDLTPDSSEFGPVWFACHDAPVILYQSDNLSEFLIELFKLCHPPYKSLVDDVHEDRIRNVWRTNPGVLDHESCMQSSDKTLCEFALALPPSYATACCPSLRINRKRDSFVNFSGDKRFPIDNGEEPLNRTGGRPSEAFSIEPWDRVDVNYILRIPLRHNIRRRTYERLVHRRR
ncbi:MAG: SMI1/KNR4 family protein, partial [Planctomycetota bacterium]|jgi:hypothetical protein